MTPKFTVFGAASGNSGTGAPFGSVVNPVNSPPSPASSLVGSSALLALGAGSALGAALGADGAPLGDGALGCAGGRFLTMTKPMTAAKSTPNPTAVHLGIPALRVARVRAPQRALSQALAQIGTRPM